MHKERPFVLLGVLIYRGVDNSSDKVYNQIGKIYTEGGLKYGKMANANAVQRTR